MYAFIEFINENSERRYPLAEDSVPVGGSFAWPNNILLDVRGFSRISPAQPVAMIRYSGATSTPDGIYDPPALHSSLFIRVGSPDVLVRIDVPEDEFLFTTFPFHTEAMIEDPRTGALLARVSVTIGSAWRSIDTSMRYNFAESAPLEPALVADLYRQQVDLIGILHRNDTAEDVSGDVVIRGGHNIAAEQDGDKITLLAGLGMGELGHFPGPVAGNTCRELIYSIGTATPDSSGKILFTAGKGIVITVPSPHRVVITLDTSGLTPAGSCQ